MTFSLDGQCNIITFFLFHRRVAAAHERALLRDVRGSEGRERAASASAAAADRRGSRRQNSKQVGKQLKADAFLVNMAEKLGKPPPLTMGTRPVPMKLFATWEVDRTPPNCIPR